MPLHHLPGRGDFPDQGEARFAETRGTPSYGSVLRLGGMRLAMILLLVFAVVADVIRDPSRGHWRDLDLVLDAGALG